jgi:hypothetical protein
MTRHRIVACSAIALALVASAPALADAQRLTRAGSAARPAVITQEDIMDAEARGDGFAQSGQFAEAREAYRAATTLQLRMRELPANAMWQIANAYYAEGASAKAARTLDELAALAAEHRAPDVRARALLEAAFLYRAAGHWQRPQEIAKELRLMCEREALDPELKATIERRLGK